MIIDTDKLKLDIAHAEEQRDRYKELHKEWKQLVFRLKSDLLKAERINSTQS